ncbi:Co2+/Mg2+ efflux protein ApaG [Deinococcus sonorensis]|uniref:Co2+/Mg2+ efflux protein ApaG n=2 Tax=Deinococcus sonorensis TaxID=309891 RepID=A0AAU7U9Z2_9DEIO
MTDDPPRPELPAPDLRVQVQVQLRPEPTRAGGQLYQYVIRIENHSDESWQLMAREWTITDATGQVTQVQGEGVVGQTPIIAPGGVFVYDSFVTLQRSPGTMRGAYLLRDAWGATTRLAIPEFRLGSGPDSEDRVLN